MQILSFSSQRLFFDASAENQSYDIVATNNTDEHAYFKVRTNNPRQYFVRPSLGSIPPNGSQVISFVLVHGVTPQPDHRDRFIILAAPISKEQHDARQASGADIWEDVSKAYPDFQKTKMDVKIQFPTEADAAAKKADAAAKPAATASGFQATPASSDATLQQRKPATGAAKPADAQVSSRAPASTATTVTKKSGTSPMLFILPLVILLGIAAAYFFKFK
ncbi:hypothetical protein H696_01107 [Fonticula alba]|uniref:MSP domain-containing protein n=1 Tax=Fonticula alba TaxID=691883 RepID=A0A058ZCM3_FONAL|nr:hypothetical protein H696_01107 [Fonticula alba]KCV71683.1 hypothetical protein H696_01107 [Fonticula alba]|eukprot:XP_009493261.1 hypothetical protein H696_01107 [Fonticula alba]